MNLDSDTQNADAQLHVEFYEYKGEGPYQGKPFVRIVVPGDKTNVIDQPAREDHKRRFQRQWLYFQSKQDGPVIGTSLLIWHQERPQELTEGQLGELVILKFQSVEQVATASDGQIMRVGMGATGLRERALRYLSSKNAQTSGAELLAAQAQIKALQEAVAQITTMHAAQPLQAAAKRKTGWPKGKPRPKKASVNDNHNNAPAGAAGSQ